ncbi:uncharacterized protein LOC106664385 isoform X2 [Cimex lectularius]|uniref:Uncharacterized protein n=1 Tax=Cimex lectularius TaxID=79782 RepID=A0A8I6RNU7_CIMLE|nr:uncharacterized protein LOC106664385 isoform X2 [Cimex lectularius]
MCRIKVLLATGDFANSLSCAEIQEKGSGSAFTIDELKTLSKLEADDLKSCIVLLGKERLSTEQSSVIWMSLLDIFGSAGEIPEEYIRQLGWVINGIPAEHFMNISLSDVDTIASLGKCKELSSAQLSGLRDGVVEQWKGKDIDDFTSFDLITLKQIICSFNSSLLQMIHPISYKDAAVELATLKNCPLDVLQVLASLATSPDSFGSAAKWTSVQLANVGCVIVGLPSINVLPNEAMEGLTPQIIDCLPPVTLQSMSDGQISRFSPAAASALSSSQISALSDSQKYALSQAVDGAVDKEKNAALRHSVDKELYQICILIFFNKFLKS